MKIKRKLEDIIDDLRKELWWSSVKSGVNFQFLLLHVQHFHPPVRRTIWYAAERVFAGLLYM